MSDQGVRMNDYKIKEFMKWHQSLTPIQKAEFAEFVTKGQAQNATKVAANLRFQQRHM